MQAQIVACRYRFDSADPPHTANYVTPSVLDCCRRIGARRILDLGSGNGALCDAMSKAGFDVVGCDPSEEGVEISRRTYPHLEFHRLGVYDDPATLSCPGFDAVISTEVIEHLFLPRSLPHFARAVLQPKGYLILSTPYHGYVKNLSLSLAGKWDRHLTPLWDGGHIKFWSRKTLTALAAEEGFTCERFIGVGRVPYLWKSMILVLRLG